MTQPANVVTTPALPPMEKTAASALDRVYMALPHLQVAPGAFGADLSMPNGSRFRRESFEAIAPRRSAWLRKGLLPASGIGFLVGASQARKSFLAIDWGLRIGRGMPVMGLQGPERGVVYVASEGANGVRKRVAAWRQERPGPSSMFDLISEAPNLMADQDLDGLLAALQQAKDDFASMGCQLGMVVIDTLAASMPGGDENSGKDMSALLANVHRIGLELGAFVLIVAHTGKDESRGLRGWSGQFAGADTVITLAREKGAELTTGEVEKQKDGEAGRRFAFSAEEVEIGVDEDGDPITSLVLAYAEADQIAERGRGRDISPQLRHVLTAIQALVDAGRFGAVRDVPDVPRGTRAVLRADLKSELMKAGVTDADDNPDSVKRRINRQIQALVERGKIRATETQLWVI